MEYPDVKSDNRWRLVRSWAPWLFTALMVWFFVAQVDIADVGPVLEHFSWPWFLAGLGCYIATNLLRAWRTWLFLGQSRSELPLLLPVSFVVSLANNALPARMGEVAYVYFVNRLLKTGVGSTTAGLIAIRIFDYLTVASMFLAAWVAAAGTLSLAGQQVALLTVPILLAGLALLAALPWIGDRLLAIGLRLLSWVRLGRLVDRVGREGLRAVETLRLLRAPLLYLRMVGTSLGIWVFTYLWFLCFLIACNFPTTFGLVVFGATFAVLTKAIPLASIGGFGTHEAGWTIGFMLVGFQLPAAILSGFAVNVLTLAVSALFGFPALLLLAWFDRRRARAEAALSSDSPKG